MSKNLIMGAIVGNSGFRRPSSTAPVITDFIIKDITDVAMTIEANVNPNGDSTAVSIFNGATEIPLAAIPAGNSPVLISHTITGLLPYTNYSIHIEAVNTVGSDSTATLTRNTLEPLELTDGNWAAMWDANYEKNVISPTNTIGELRDKLFDCALGEEINPQVEFDSSTEFSTSAGFVIADGKLTITNAESGAQIQCNIPTEDKSTGCFRISTTGAIVTSGGISIRVSSIATPYSGGVQDVPLASGDTTKETAMFVAVSNNVFYIRATATGTSAILENLSIKRILGKHAICTLPAGMPVKLPTDNYFSFDGINDFFKAHISSIGTVYAFVKRDGLDPDFTVHNSLTGIGEVSTYLTIGQNIAETVRYKVDVRKISIRTVTDSPETITKLNEWFLRESHELPETPGILATGVWNDDAVDNDNAIFKDSPE